MDVLRSLWHFIFDIIQTIVFAIAVFLFLYLLVIQPHKIKGDSMQPNFPNGEYLLTEKVTYRFNFPKRGDVVVFKAPGESEDEYIKRVIGLPGEKVSIQNGKIFVNDKLLDESAYLKSTVYTSGGTFLATGKEVIVPEGKLFVVGDNRPYSSDSRYFGFIDPRTITGKAWIVYWPRDMAGKVPVINYP